VTMKTVPMILVSTLLLAMCCLPLAAQDNPLLVPFTTPLQTPPFDQIQLDHFRPAVEEGIKRQQAEIDAITNNPETPSFENTITAYDLSGQLLKNVTGIFFSLLGTISSPERREIAAQLTPLLTAHNDNIFQNETLFARLKNLYERRDKLSLTVKQRYLLENTYRDFVRSGASLDSAQKARLRDINREQSLLVLKFNENLLAETNDSYIIIDSAADLAGLPEAIITMGRETAEAMNLPGKWVFTTQRPSCTPFWQYADSRHLREALYTAYVMRGDRDNAHDNKAILQKIFCLREERCRLLGFSTPAEYSLENRMAKTPQAVDAFLKEAWKPALERAKGEAAEMQAIIDREGGGFKLAPWDWWYYAEKLRQAKYDLDDAALRPYFQLENVRQGAFTLANKLFGLKFIPRRDIPVYHPEVEVFEVQESNGTLIGLLYTDFFPRDSKRGGAWSGSFRDAFYQDGKRVIPFSTLICNITKPTPETPSLLSVDEVKTVFHEFGHCLNTLLYNGRSRASYAADDAGELPSQIMENWVLEPEFLKLYARHYQTGEVIPTALVDKLNHSRLFNQGFDTVEYVAACFLDMAWHTLGDARNVNITNFENRVMADIGLIPEILPRYRTTYFTHIQGGYQAGYYIYLWSEVLDADAFQAFKETSLFDKKTAAAYRKNVLEEFGTEDTMTLYKRFRGREPEMGPYLSRRGLR